MDLGKWVNGETIHDGAKDRENNFGISSEVKSFLQTVNCKMPMRHPHRELQISRWYRMDEYRINIPCNNQLNQD